MRARGINFLPESLGEFEETSAWNEIAKECVGHHNYQTEEVKKFVAESEAEKETKQNAQD